MRKQNPLNCGNVDVRKRFDKTPVTTIDHKGPVAIPDQADVDMAIVDKYMVA
jgi:hypothetical protein